MTVCDNTFMLQLSWYTSPKPVELDVDDSRHISVSRLRRHCAKHLLRTSRRCLHGHHGMSLTYCVNTCCPNYIVIFKIVYITVCTVVQNYCNGRSKKYRKWHFWGCSLSKTLQRIDKKFGRNDYVGDGSQCAKWHINRFRSVISAKGWNVNGLCFFIFFIFCSFFSAARGHTVDRFWRVIRQNACFWGVAFLLGL